MLKSSSPGSGRGRARHKFFFSRRRRHTRLQGDWSSDVCSSDLPSGRAAPMGPVGPGVVTATFFGFRHDMVARALPDAWGFASVADILAARLTGVDAALR